MKPAQPHGIGVEVGVTGGDVGEGVRLAVAVAAVVALTTVGEVAAAVREGTAEFVSAAAVPTGRLRVMDRLHASALSPVTHNTVRTTLWNRLEAMPPPAMGAHIRR
jgi:hypothetical protein